MKLKIYLFSVFVLLALLTCNREVKENVPIMNTNETVTNTNVQTNATDTNMETVQTNLDVPIPPVPATNETKEVIETKLTNRMNLKTEPEKSLNEAVAVVEERPDVRMDHQSENKVVKAQKEVTVSADKSEINFDEVVGIEPVKTEKVVELVKTEPVYKEAGRIVLEAPDSVYSEPVKMKRAESIIIEDTGPFIRINAEQKEVVKTEQAVAVSASGGLLLTLIIIALLL